MSRARELCVKMCDCNIWWMRDALHRLLVYPCEMLSSVCVYISVLLSISFSIFPFTLMLFHVIFVASVSSVSQSTASRTARIQRPAMLSIHQTNRRTNDTHVYIYTHGISTPPERMIERLSPLLLTVHRRSQQLLSLCCFNCAFIKKLFNI